MNQQLELHPISLQYQVRTSKQGYREIARLLPLLGGNCRTQQIKHRWILGQAGVPNKQILRLQSTGITDLRQHDPDFANISTRLAESVVRRVNDSYHRAFTVRGAGFPRMRSPHQFRTLEISEPINKHVKFRKSGVCRDPYQGLAHSVVQDRPPDQHSGTAPDPSGLPNTAEH